MHQKYRYCRYDNFWGPQFHVWWSNVSPNLDGPHKSRVRREWHFFSDGSVDQTNFTLESMLKCTHKVKDWNSLIQYLLFALWDVPHSGSKHSSNIGR